MGKGIELGGSAAVKTGLRKGVAYALQYINEEPALVLWNPSKPPGAGAFILGLSSAFKYTSDEYLVRQSAIAAKYMGFQGTKSEVMAIADNIMISIDDLVMMPPEPPKDKGTAVGVAELSVGGKVIEIAYGEDGHVIH